MAFDPEALAAGLDLEPAFVADTLSHHRVDGTATEPLSSRAVTETVASVVRRRAGVFHAEHALHALRRATSDDRGSLADKDRVMVAAWLSEIAGNIAYDPSATPAGEVE